MSSDAEFRAVTLKLIEEDLLAIDPEKTLSLIDAALKSSRPRKHFHFPALFSTRFCFRNQNKTVWTPFHFALAIQLATIPWKIAADTRSAGDKFICIYDGEVCSTTTCLVVNDIEGKWFVEKS